MKNLIDRTLTVLISWYQDGKISAIDEHSIIAALETFNGEGIDWEGTDIVTQILNLLTENEDKDILLLQGTVL